MVRLTGSRRRSTDAKKSTHSRQDFDITVSGKLLQIPEKKIKKGPGRKPGPLVPVIEKMKGRVQSFLAHTASTFSID